MDQNCSNAKTQTPQQVVHVSKTPQDCMQWRVNS